jgi:hypothetical protein
VRTVQVAGSASGIVGNGNQPGSCGEVTGTGEGAQITGTDQQRGTEKRPEARHGLDDRGLRMLLEGLLDLLVEGLQAFIEREDAGRELGNDGAGEVLAGEHDRLRFGGSSRLDVSGQGGGSDQGSHSR